MLHYDREPVVVMLAIVVFVPCQGPFIRINKSCGPRRQTEFWYGRKCEIDKLFGELTVE
jgi:hypothetical protein